MDYYSLGVPGYILWPMHMVIGAFIAYIGYCILYKQSINPNWGIVLLVLGVTAIFYHAHLWYLNYMGFDPILPVVK